MEKLTIHGKTINYQTKPTRKKSSFIEIKDDIVCVNIIATTTKKDAILMIKQRFLDLYYKIHPEEQNTTIHFNGKAYKAILKKGKNKNVEIKGENIIITSPVYNYNNYRMILRDFYKKTIEQKLTELIYDAQYDFKEVAFPKIKVMYLKNYFGNYHKIKNRIIISSLMAKYDLKYVKVVLYHELSHTRYMNHEQEFLDYFEKKLPGGPALDDEFKQNKYNDFL